MSRASAAQTVLPLGDQPQAVHGWDQVLMAAFADPDRASGFLPQAEEAVRAHPGDDRIFGRDQAAARRRAVSNADTRRPVKIKASEPRHKRAPAPAVEAPVTPVAPPSLPVINIAISFSADFDLAPLLAAMQKPPDSDGGWHGLRERFAHLGLAQGFDELLCLPHLRGIETFWYQVETVRKVLKQFRGRVLLADEVRLGKTVEAGIG